MIFFNFAMTALATALVVGALAFVAGAHVGAGRVACSRVHWTGPAAEPPPVCGCGHNIAFHDDNLGRCREHNKEPVALTGRTIWYPRCACRRYVGPEPMPRMVTS